MMTPTLTVNCIDRLLKDIMRCGKEMGGKTEVFGVDFRQVLPVIPKGGKVKVIESLFRLLKSGKKLKYYI